MVSSRFRGVAHRSTLLILHEDHGLGIPGALVHALLHHIGRGCGELGSLSGTPDQPARGAFHHETVPLERQRSEEGKSAMARVLR